MLPPKQLIYFPPLTGLSLFLFKVSIFRLKYMCYFTVKNIQSSKSGEKDSGQIVTRISG